MAEQLYPKPKRDRDRSGLRWRVDYDLAYDFCSGEFSEYYATRLQAKIAAFWNVRIASWGGSATLIDQHAGKES